MRKSLNCAAALLAGVLWLPEGSTAQEAADVRLGRVPEELVLDFFRATADRRSVVFSGYYPSGKRLLFTGFSKREYDAVGLPFFSADGRRFGYDARSNGKAFIVIDGEPGEGHESVRGGILGAETGNVAYIARDEGKDRVVVGGKRGDPYDLVDHLRFDPTGKTVSYLAKKEGKEFWVLGDTVGKPCDSLRRHRVWSPDGRRFVYLGRVGDRWLLTPWGEEGVACEDVDHVSFSDEGEDLAWGMLEGGRWDVVVRSRGGVRRIQNARWPVYGRERRLAYVRMTNFKQVLTDGEWTSEAYDAISWPRFLETGAPLFIAEKAGRQAVVVGDKAGDFYEHVYPESIRTAPGESKLAFQVKEGGKTRYVVEGLSGKAYVDLGDDGAWRKSPSGETRFTYRAFDGKGWYVVRGDWTSERFEEVRLPPIAAKAGPDVFVGKRDGKESLYVGGSRVGEWDGMDLSAIEVVDGKVKCVVLNRGEFIAKTIDAR